jgi:hypothetical protein
VPLFAFLLIAAVVAHPWISLLLALSLLGGAIIFGSPSFFPYSFNSPSSQEKVHDLGGFDVKFVRVAGPSSYPNPAGIVLTPSVFGLRAIEWSCPEWGSRYGNRRCEREYPRHRFFDGTGNREQHEPFRRILFLPRRRHPVTTNLYRAVRREGRSADRPLSLPRRKLWLNLQTHPIVARR